MKYPLLRNWIASLALGMMLACVLPLPVQASESVTVMADSSLGVALAKVARRYSRSTNTVINISYLPQKIQQAHIIEGGAADLVITPKTDWIEEMKRQGLVDAKSQVSIAKNRLALIGPKDTPIKAEWPKFPAAAIIEAIGKKPGFVIGNPETLPEGVYAREALRKLTPSGELEPFILAQDQLSGIFDAVRTHGAYGLALYSDTLAQNDITVIDLVPESAHKPIEYFAVVVAGENMDAARKFLEYLKEDDAQRLLREGGL